jgi:hypothetical protein
VQKEFTETKEEDGYSQDINIRLISQDFMSAALLDTLLKKKVRCVVIDNLNYIRVAGLHNGMDVEVMARGGGSKIDFNGYELRFTGLEPFSAPYLSAFPGSGFLKEGVTLSCLLASSDKPASLMDKVSSCSIVQ